MRAVLVEDFGPIENHKLSEIETPTPGRGEVLIDIHAIGINFPDTLMMPQKNINQRLSFSRAGLRKLMDIPMSKPSTPAGTVRRFQCS